MFSEFRKCGSFVGKIANRHVVLRLATEGRVLESLPPCFCSADIGWIPP